MVEGGALASLVVTMHDWLSAVPSSVPLLFRSLFTGLRHLHVLWTRRESCWDTVLALLPSLCPLLQSLDMDHPN